jgi:hypothetical protein
MASTGRLSDRVVVDQMDARHKLDRELHEINEQLQVIIDTCQRLPSVIDDYILGSTNGVISIEATIVEAYQVMKTNVYSSDSPLRASSDLWEAFLEQKDEFLGFYTSALNELEVYKEVLQAYNSFRAAAKLLPDRSGLERIRRYKHIHVDERDKCIGAVTDFYGKFSAMLAVLAGRPAPVNRI